MAVYPEVGDGVAASYGISGAGLVVKPSSGRLVAISVTTAGTTPGTAYDFNSLSSPSNVICVIPNTVGVTVVKWPVTKGIVIVPGTGQVVSISYA